MQRYESMHCRTKEYTKKILKMLSAEALRAEMLYKGYKAKYELSNATNKQQAIYVQ